MSDLLELAVEAHGGLEKWQKLRSIRARVSGLKGWPDIFTDTRVAIKPHGQRTEYSPFVEAGRQRLYEPNRTTIVAHDGDIIDQRESPRN